MMGGSVCSDIADTAGKFLEIPGFREAAIYGGEADIGDRVDLLQPFHHHLAYPGGGDLCIAGYLHLSLNAGDELVDLFLLDRPLAAGEGDGLLDFAAVEWLAPAVALRHGHFAQLHPLESGEARTTAFALAAAADRGVVLGRARVLHLAVVMRAERAPHGLFPDLEVKRDTGSRDQTDRPAHHRKDEPGDGADRRAGQDRLGCRVAHTLLGHAHDFLAGIFDQVRFALVLGHRLTDRDRPGRPRTVR